YDQNGKRQYEKLKVLRISGAASSDKKELKNFLKKLEAAKNKDYCTLGVEMGLFAAELASFKETAKCWLPKGQFIKERLLNFLRIENEKSGFKAVSTPRIVKKIFANNFDLPVEIEGEEYALAEEKLKLHALLYRAEKDLLPVRYFEMAEDAEYATCFCREDQADGELISCLQLIDKIANMLGFEYRYVLNRGKVKGSSKKISERLEKALNSLKLEFAVDKEAANEYINTIPVAGVSGSSIELEVCDVFKRKWCISSLQIIEKNEQTANCQAPVTISRVFKSLEQFIALLIERHNGLLPLWLAETEVIVLPIAERNISYAKEIESQLKEANIRVLLDESLLKLGEKIQKAERKKIPYMLIAGDNEKKNGTVAVRAFSQEKDAAPVQLSLFLKQLAQERSI
ncbi:MAG TPA: His/Gly/Thr/Pro-type tRNA ligase C-terminal domain-containing protein, partial [Parachlamydiaceae bacterium]|nr:His/Gly/Thr/Pro-type tRNA ligase C-terminal domain-containing protein [Parachlamydiaceae bacterium]